MATAQPLLEEKQKKKKQQKPQNKSQKYFSVPSSQNGTERSGTGEGKRCKWTVPNHKGL